MIAEQRGDPVITGFPEITAGQHLIEAMWKMRPTRGNGMAELPADWPEIAAFGSLTGRITERWEAEALFDMCHGYLHAKTAGENPLSIAPVDQGMSD